MNTGKYAAKYVGNSLACANSPGCGSSRTRRHFGRCSSITPPIAARQGRRHAGRADPGLLRVQHERQGAAPGRRGRDSAADLRLLACEKARRSACRGCPAADPEARRAGTALRLCHAGKPSTQQNCALCHGEEGAGAAKQKNTKVFPPLWGPQSFNWGAGMHPIGECCGIHPGRRPLGKGGSLSEQDAWDVALFMNSHERPQDPRFAGSVEATRKKYHDLDDSMYGRTVDGKVLGSR